MDLARRQWGWGMWQQCMAFCCWSTRLTSHMLPQNATQPTTSPTSLLTLAPPARKIVSYQFLFSHSISSVSFHLLSSIFFLARDMISTVSPFTFTCAFVYTIYLHLSICLPSNRDAQTKHQHTHPSTCLPSHLCLFPFIFCIYFLKLHCVFSIFLLPGIPSLTFSSEGWGVSIPCILLHVFIWYDERLVYQ